MEVSFLVHNIIVKGIEWNIDTAQILENLACLLYVLV